MGASIDRVRGGLQGAIALVALHLLGCATAGGEAAPVVPAAPLTAAEYYPLQPGWKWSYDIERDGQHILAFYAVIERLGDNAIIQAGEERLIYTVTPQGITRKEGAGPGDFLIKDPIAVGASWALAQGKAQVVSVGKQLTVPAGTYQNCVVVEETKSEPMRIVRTTFAPGVGPISVELEVQEGGRFVTTTRASLRGVTRPGQDPLAM